MELRAVKGNPLTSIACGTRFTCMTRKTRDARKVAPAQAPVRGKAITVQFFLEEDRLVRELARQDGNRPVGDTVRVLALAEAKRRAAAVVMGGPVAVAVAS